MSAISEHNLIKLWGVSWRNGDRKQTRKCRKILKIEYGGFLAWKTGFDWVETVISCSRSEITTIKRSRTVGFADFSFEIAVSRNRVVYFEVTEMKFLGELRRRKKVLKIEFWKSNTVGSWRGTEFDWTERARSWPGWRFAWKRRSSAGVSCCDGDRKQIRNCWKILKFDYGGSLEWKTDFDWIETDISCSGSEFTTKKRIRTVGFADFAFEIASIKKPRGLFWSHRNKIPGRIASKEEDVRGFPSNIRRSDVGYFEKESCNENWT